MKKIYYVSIALIVMIVSFLGITYSFEYPNDGGIVFEIIGPDHLYVDVGSEYEEYGIKATYNGSDISNRISIDSSLLDMNTLGEYNVKYQFGDEYVYRKVIVIDKEAPVITLYGGSEVNILMGGKYEEAGYLVTDNYDKDLSESVKVSGSVDINKEGEYTLTYTVTDSSGNTGSVSRKIIVKKAVITLSNSFNRVSPYSYNVSLYSNTIVKNNFNSNGIYLEGYVRNKADSYKLKLKNNRTEYVFNMSASGNYYKGNINLVNVTNGEYMLYVIGNSEERVISKLDIYSKIIRSHVGNKLVTVSYDNDLVSIKIEDFIYQYDVVIDPGHGGSDPGAGNGLAAEINLNLRVSKYEKCRYESMGYRVYMTRYDNSAGEMLGNSGLDPLDRRGLTIGYYGAVSKVVYSNHHNASSDRSYHGFEILVPNQASSELLSPELAIYKRFMDYYKINDSYYRIYSKNYDTSQMYNKANGEVYGYKNYYSVIRIPYELYNVKMVIYEPIYLSNANDYNWYYASGNWVKVSELKIQEYVKYMGGNYIPDNSMCL